MKKTHRFLGTWQLGMGMVRVDDADLAHQMRSVLKLEPGEEVILGDGAGNEAYCRIAGYQTDVVLLECLSLARNANEPQIRVTLYCAILKSDNFELAAQKATEVGIHAIVPIITARTVKHSIRIDRVRKIVREAAEQAGRGIVPPVSDPVDLAGAFDLAGQHDALLFFDPEGKPFKGVAARVQTVGLCIGPEGGWEDREIAVAEEIGAVRVSLSPLILRAETAVTVASDIVVNNRKV